MALCSDLLVIASGSRIRPDMTPGLLGEHWYRKHFDFYTLEGATGLAARLDAFEGGRFVIDTVEMPIKCPVAPLEFIRWINPAMKTMTSGMAKLIQVAKVGCIGPSNCRMKMAFGPVPMGVPMPPMFAE